MKVVILAGGYGTRISEESHLKPKPMIEIGGMPILWHIMKYYSHSGFNDFIICCGYRGYMIKEYFANYYLHRSDITIDFTKKHKVITHSDVAEPWKVTMVDTGLDTSTGGRVKRIQKYVGREPFMLTYGDGVADVDLKKLISFHKKGGKYATVTAVQIAARFGTIDIVSENGGAEFSEKSKETGTWANGGFMVLEPEIFKYIKDDQSIFETQVLEKLSGEKKLGAYKHQGFWHPMDTLRDKNALDEMIASGNAPWMVWKS